MNSFHNLLVVALLVVAGVSPAGADCPTGCPKRCPAQEDVQSDFMRSHFDISKFWGVFYEVGYHDSTQPTNPLVNAKCQRSVKSQHPGDPRNYKDLFSMRVGPSFSSTNAVCDLEFNISDAPGVFLGHWKSSSPFNPHLENINNTVVDVGVAANGTYNWTLEFQCKDDDDAEKGIRFIALNFYHRNPLIDQEELALMESRLRARGLGWVIDVSPGLHLVDQKTCVEANNYPAIDAPTSWCGQKSASMLTVV